MGADQKLVSLPLARLIQDLISCMMAAMVLVTSATPDSPAESKEAGEYLASDIQEVGNIRQQRKANKGKAKRKANKGKAKRKANKGKVKRKANKGKAKRKANKGKKKKKKKKKREKKKKKKKREKKKKKKKKKS